MNKNILNYIEECEAWKVGIKNLHWSADNLSQHELCDDIADEISEFEDLVSEVEQSISGKIKLNGFTPKSYNITSLKSFVEDVISASQSFLKELEGMGEKYIGIKSECETFIGTMQRKLYLVNFTLKEELKKRLRDKINESRPKNLANTVDVEKFMGRRPKTIKARINQIYRIVKKYGIDSRKYHDEAWQAIDDYYRAITSLGCGVELKPCGHLNNVDSMESDGGYCDYAEDGMPRSKQYAIKIMFEDGMAIDGYIKCMAAGTVSDPFASYDTCMVLWPKSNKVLENKSMEYNLTESEVKELVKEAAMQIINEIDYSQIPMGDFYERNKWFKQQTDTDFPNHGVKDSDNWQNTYSDLASKKAEQDKIEAKAKAKESSALRRKEDAKRRREAEKTRRKVSRMKYGDGQLVAVLDMVDCRAYWALLDSYKEVQNNGEWDVELYNDGTWLPYEETYGPASKMPSKLEPYLMKMFKKLGMREGDGIDESKKSMKVTESEVKELVREAAMQIINEYNNRMAKVSKFVRSTHGHGDASKRIKKATPEERAEARRKLGIKEPVKVEEESIDIDPKNKGKFNATKKATGKSTEELTHSKNPLTRKRAIFAQNAKKWSHKKS